MKQTLKSIFITIVVIMALTSCKKEIIELPKQPNKERKDKCRTCIKTPLDTVKYRSWG